MEFTVLYRPAVKKDIKQLEKSILPIVKNIITKEIVVNPFLGKILKTKYQIYTWKVRKIKTDYRIAYEVRKESHEVVILMVGTRENFYKRLSKRVK